MIKNFARTALVGLLSAAVAFGTAACAPGNIAADGSNLSTSLDPVPLDEPTTITMTMVGKLEYFTPALLAISQGEFEKENLTIDLQILPLTESIPALAQGQTDVAVSGIAAPVLNAVEGGAELKMVLPGANSSSGDGLYVKTELAELGPQALKGTKIGLSVGIAQSSIVPITEYLAEGGLTLDDVSIEIIPQLDLPAALLSGQIDGAWVTAPQHLSLLADGAAVKVAAYDDGTYTTGIFFGPNLLEGNPQVGQAVVRALTRTTLTYLQGDYKADPEIAQMVADALEVTVEDVRKTDSLVYGFDINTEIFTKAQKIWLEAGEILTYDQMLEPGAYVDSSFFDRITLG